jgi:ornithine carbamoyltransferase
MNKLLSIQDLDADELSDLVATGERLAAGKLDFSNALRGRIVGLYFSKPSTRTRTSFFAAVSRMGGQALTQSAADLQTSTGESLEDTGMVLGLYLDALVMRTNESTTDMYTIAEHAGGMPVINALSKCEHPTQAIADLVTIHQEFGALAGKHVLYLGAWNNTAASLTLAVTKMAGMKMTVATPEKFAPSPELISAAGDNARISGAELRVLSGTASLPHSVDVIYTTRWASMGEIPRLPEWQREFLGFQVDSEALQRLSHPRTIFMHDLPAQRGLETTDRVIDGPASRIRRQAFNKQISAMCVLERSLRARPPRSI